MRPTQGGFTMTEIMVSVALVGIAAAFTFSIQVRSSSAFRDQANVSEAQQGVRASSELLARDLRNVGYLAREIRSPALGADRVAPIIIDNDTADGTDTITVIYGDSSTLTWVLPTANLQAASPDETLVGSEVGFAQGDKILVTMTQADPARYGRACVLALSSVNPGLLGHAGTVATWNAAGNPQCDNSWITIWNDSGNKTVVSKLVMRGYRVRPGDGRGILELSPSGGLSSDWQPLAVGIVDLQVAMRVYEPGDATDADGDGKPEWDWYSGDDMETVLNTAIAGVFPTASEVSVTLVARTTKEVSGAGAARTPDILVVGAEEHNALGDHAGTDLPVTNPSSPFYGNHVYRTMTTKVDLRNLKPAIAEPE